MGPLFKAIRPCHGPAKMANPMAFDDDPPESFQKPRFSGPPGGLRNWFLGVGASGLAGALFSAFSSFDFIAHLDRQVHSIHCSFIPGAGRQIGESGCRTVMMSPYSSVLRESFWGGMPISLLALAVFAYIVYRSLDFAFDPQASQRETKFLVAATALPLLMSLIYGYISATKIGALCKLCVGVYIASALAFIFAMVAHSRARPPRVSGGLPVSPGPLYARWFLEGVAYVATITLIYIGFAPVSTKSKEGCGVLVKSKSRSSGVKIPFMPHAGKTPAIALLDPLCPACKSFDNRLLASDVSKELDLSVVLFPLDNRCNWMVKSALHPGACTMSEAVLCDPKNAKKIVSWAFEHQEELTKTAKESERALKQRVIKAFPSVRGCVGSAKIKNKLNKSLRWAVANALPVLTPQLFIADRRVCDEDTDLGLEYTVSQMLKGAR